MTFGNDTPNWKSKWARSPRQDRRVIEEGKFVELGKVQLPEPPKEEEVNTALEVVNETVEPSTSASPDVRLDGPTESVGERDGAIGQTDSASGQGKTGIVQSVPDSSIPSTEVIPIDPGLTPNPLDNREGFDSVFNPEPPFQVEPKTTPPLIAPIDIVDEANGIEREAKYWQHPKS